MEQDPRMEKTLRISKLIKDVPPFDGTQHELNGFIAHIDTIIKYAEPADTIYQDLFIRNVKAKILGNAKATLQMYNTADTWADTRRDLINHFADKRNESYLIQQLHTLYQNSDPIEIFFAKIQDILNTLKNWCKLNCVNANGVADKPVVDMKTQWYDTLGLSIFISHIREPLGTMLRTKEPATLQAARDFCIREENLRNLNNKQSPSIPYRNPQFKKPTPNPIFRRQFYPQNSYQVQPYIPPYIPYTPQIQTPPKPPPRAPAQPFQPLQSPQAYYNHRPFAPKGRAPSQKPEPMDNTSNLNKYKQPTFGQYAQQKPPQNYQFRQTGPPRFAAKEIHHTEELPNEEYFDPDVFSEYEEEYSDENPIVEVEVDEQDFQPTPSETLDS